MDQPPFPSQQFLLNAFCTRCGYDLRANNIAGPCPKCGLQISYASFSSGLRNANLLWLHRISLGITGILTAHVLFVIDAGTKLLNVLARGAFLSYFHNWWTQIVEVAFAIEWFSVVYLIASARDDPEDQQRRISPRRLLLVFGGGWVVAYLLFRIGHLIPPFVNIRWIIVALMQIAAMVALFHYMNHLARRIGDPFLRRHLPLAMTLTIISVGFGFILGLNSMYRTSSNWDRTQDVRYLMALAASGYFLYVLIRLRKSLADALADSKREHEPAH